MKIWYSDNNFPSGLTPFILEARDAPGIDISDAYDFRYVKGANSSDMPDYLIVNPGAIPGDQYWKDLKECASFCSDTTKVLVGPMISNNIWEARRFGLDSLENVTLMDLSSAADELVGLLNKADE